MDGIHNISSLQLAVCPSSDLTGGRVWNITLSRKFTNDHYQVIFTADLHQKNESSFLVQCRSTYHSKGIRYTLSTNSSKVNSYAPGVTTQQYAHDFSPKGCTPLVAATSTAGPVAVFSPARPLFGHPLQAHVPSPQGHAPVSPPQLQVVLSVPGTCWIVFSLAALLPPASSLFEQPLQAHLSSAQGQAPSFPPQLHVVLPSPASFIFFSFAFPAFRSARRRASA